jgi:iron-sulfur cluster assembly protein
MITITPKARTVLERRSGADNRYLRITVKSGGCAGMTYDAELDSLKYDHERVIQIDGNITVLSTDDSLQFLDGLVIDYSDDLISAGFRFRNASNDSSCGCGASFALASFPQINREALSCGT